MYHAFFFRINARYHCDVAALPMIIKCMHFPIITVSRRITSRIVSVIPITPMPMKAGITAFILSCFSRSSSSRLSSRLMASISSFFTAVTSLTSLLGKLSITLPSFIVKSFQTINQRRQGSGQSAEPQPCNQKNLEPRYIRQNHRFSLHP